MVIAGKTLCGSCFEQQVTDSDICDACGFDNSAAVENTGTLPIGMLLAEKYIIGRVLGRGGFGITYLAYDKVNGGRVAVKEYFPDSLSYRVPGTVTITNYTGDKEDYYKTGVEKFYSEAKILSRFNGNDHIINVMEFFYANNTAYYIMEYVNGIDLKKYIALKGGRLPFGEVLDIMVPVTYALTIVHSMDILHRDISPDNIYLTKDGNIKILDFGAARQVYGESDNLSVILKQGFAPLEQYRKRGNHGPWSDIYSLGATAYFALTGAMPEESVNRVERDDLLMPSQLGIPIPADFEAILRKMLAVKAEDRYQSMIELKESMRGLGALPAARKGASAGAAKPKPGQKALPLKFILGGAVAVCVLIVAVAAWMLFGTKNVTEEPYTMITTSFKVNCSYTGEWKSGEPNGEGELTIEEDVPGYWGAGTVLEGNFVDGLLQGKGKYTEKNGSVYTGGFKNGLRSGQGTYVFADGEKAEGEYKNHYLNGKGSYEFPSGVRYEGDFVDGFFDGQGKFTFADGSVYEGSVKNDKENGEGVYTSVEGWIYTGEFVDGDFHGHGVITDLEGNILYDGAWEKGEAADPIPKREVTGEPYVYTTSLYSVPCSYTGEWENGLPNGQGTLVIAEDGTDGDFEWFKGDTYSGSFIDGLLEGYGTYSCVEGHRYEGNFASGLYNGTGKYTMADGGVYTGNFVDEHMEGEGTLAMADGWQYKGSFSKSLFNGEGALYDESGDMIYSGGFLNGEFDGAGTLWDESGDVVYSGRWKNGEAVDVN